MLSFVLTHLAAIKNEVIHGTVKTTLVRRWMHNVRYIISVLQLSLELV